MKQLLKLIECKVVLLDVDGTLVGTNDFHAHAWQKALAAFEYTIEFGAIRKLIGMGGDKVLPILANIAEDSDRGKKILEARKEIFKSQYGSKICSFDGTIDLLKKLKQMGKKCFIATSAGKDELKLILSAGKIQDMFEGQTTSDDAKKSKPDPDIIIAALKKANVTCREAVMIGDTPYDIDAAKKANVEVIAFRSGGWDDAALNGSFAIFDGPRDLFEALKLAPSQ